LSRAPGNLSPRCRASDGALPGPGGAASPPCPAATCPCLRAVAPPPHEAHEPLPACSPCVHASRAAVPREPPSLRWRAGRGWGSFGTVTPLLPVAVTGREACALAIPSTSARTVAGSVVVTISVGCCSVLA